MKTTRNSAIATFVRLKSVGLKASGLALDKDEGIEVDAAHLVKQFNDTEEAAVAAAVAVMELVAANVDAFDANAEAPQVKLLARGLSDDDLAVARSIAATLGGIIRKSASDFGCLATFVVCSNRLGWGKPAARDWRAALAALRK